MERVPQLPAPCAALRDAMFSFARVMLDRHGAFLPFGGYVAPPGQVVHVSFAPARAPPTSEDATALAFEVAEVDANAIAHALAFDIHLPVPRDGMGDAVRLHLSHVGGECADLFVPYRARMGVPTLFGTPFVLAGVPIGFPGR